MLSIQCSLAWRRVPSGLCESASDAQFPAQLIHRRRRQVPTHLGPAHSARQLLPSPLHRLELGALALHRRRIAGELPAQLLLVPSDGAGEESLLVAEVVRGLAENLRPSAVAAQVRRGGPEVPELALVRRDEDDWGGGPWWRRGRGWGRAGGCGGLLNGVLALLYVLTLGNIVDVIRAGVGSHELKDRRGVPGMVKFQQKLVSEN